MNSVQTNPVSVCIPNRSAPWVVAVTSSVLFLFHCKLSVIAAVQNSGNTPRFNGLLAAAETVRQTSCACTRSAVCASVSGLCQPNFLRVRVVGLRTQNRMKNR